MPIISNLLSLSPDSPIELFEISGFNLSNLSETLYISNYLGVAFNGISYIPIGCEAEGFDLVGQGPIPTPTLSISNVRGVISSWIDQCSTSNNYRIRGATVTRKITQRQFLDDGNNSNAPIKEFPRQEFIIEQISEETYANVKFRLCSPFDIENVTLPGRVLVRSCAWIYRSTECGYTGQGYTLQNIPTNNSTLDQCPKTLQACKVRFGNFADLPFGGAPSLNTFST